MDWSFLPTGSPGLDPVQGNMLDTLSALGPGGQLDTSTGPATGPSIPSTEQTDGNSSGIPVVAEEQKSFCVRQLSTVTLDLDGIWTSILPLLDLHTSFDETLDSKTTDLSANYPHDKLLETFFAAAQRLADLYPTAARLCLALCPERADCRVLDCIHRLPVPAALAPIDEEVEARNSPATIDLALGNLLVSCHLRALDILNRILFLTMSCFKITFNSRDSKEPQYDVPQMRVGSFTPTRDVSVYLQAHLMGHLVGRLGDEAGKLAAAVDAKGRERKDKECRVFALQCEILLERQAGKVEQLKALCEELAKCAVPK